MGTLSIVRLLNLVCTILEHSHVFSHRAEEKGVLDLKDIVDI